MGPQGAATPRRDKISAGAPNLEKRLEGIAAGSEITIVLEPRR
jgi:hypothetical protein